MEALGNPSGEFLSLNALARRYGISVETIRHWRKKGRLPKAYRFVGRVLYKLADIVKWEEVNRETDVEYSPRSASHRRPA